MRESRADPVITSGQDAVMTILYLPDLSTIPIKPRAPLGDCAAWRTTNVDRWADLVRQSKNFGTINLLAAENPQILRNCARYTTRV